MEKKIDYRFKLLYFFGIIFVVAGHCEYNGGISLFYDWFTPYAFHLGLFMFASGYFYRDEEHVGHYIGRKFKKLVVPFFIWNAVYGLFVALLHRFGFTFGVNLSLDALLVQPIKTGDQFVFNLASWYIIPLFLIQCYFALSRALMKKMHWHIHEPLFYAFNQIIGCIGIYFCGLGYFNGWFVPLMRFAYFVPFFSLGYLYKTHIENYEEKIGNTWYFAVVMGIQLIIMVVYNKQPAYTPAWAFDYWDGPVLPFIVGYLGIAFWLRVSRLMVPVLCKSKWINEVADNTFSIMMHQFFGFFVVKTVFALLHLSGLSCTYFEMDKYLTDYNYFYPAYGMEQIMVIYLIAGLVIPVWISRLLKKNKYTKFLA